MDTNQFGGTFWITIAGMTLGFFATAGIYCLKAKCNRISLCWGLLKIQRDVDAEVEENAHELEHGINPYQFQTQNYIPNNTESSRMNPQPAQPPAQPPTTLNPILVPAPTTPPLPAPINNV